MHSSSKLSFPSQFSNQTNNTQKKIHTENTQSWVELRFHPSKRQTKTTTKPITFSYFLSHQTKIEHNPKKMTNQTCKRNPPHLQRNPPSMPCWNHYQSHWSSNSNPSESLEPSCQAIRAIRFHRCQNPRGLRFEESREQMRKREKRREIMREEREIPWLKRGERVLKNYFFIPFSYSTIFHLRWYCSTMLKKI